jgi:hypothetical protein
MLKSIEGAGGAMPVTINPFADEATSVSIGDLTVENRLDQVSLYGSRDRQGVEEARRLQALLRKVVEVLDGERDRLPDRIKGIKRDAGQESIPLILTLEILAVAASALRPARTSAGAIHFTGSRHWPRGSPDMRGVWRTA